MKKTFADIAMVSHIWAQQTQSKGRIEGPRGELLANGVYGADAMLMKTVPDLLKALADLTYLDELMDREINVNMDKYDAAIAASNKAIAKATGGNHV